MAQDARGTLMDDTTIGSIGSRADTGRWTLVIVGGACIRTQALPTEGVAVLGRDPSCDVVHDRPRVSPATRDCGSVTRCRSRISEAGIAPIVRVVRLRDDSPLAERLMDREASQRRTIREDVDHIYERRIRDALARHDWNCSAVARELVVSRGRVAEIARRWRTRPPSLFRSGTAHVITCTTIPNEHAES